MWCLSGTHLALNGGALGWLDCCSVVLYNLCMNNYQIGAIKQWETKRKNGTDIPWNKGKKLGKSPKNTRINIKCIECNNYFEIGLYRKETARFCSKQCTYKNRCKSNNYNAIHIWINF